MNLLLTTAAFAMLAQSPSQTPDLRCGSYCLYVSLKALDLPVGSFDELQQRLGQPSPATGYSLAQLKEAAESYGARTLGVETTPENLRRRPGRFACIAHLDGNHFVNIYDVDEKEAWIIDPPRRYTIPLDTLSIRWDGTALLLAREPLLAEEDLPREVPWLTIAAVCAAVLLLGAVVWMVRGMFRQKAEA